MALSFTADFDEFDEAFGRLTHWPNMRTVLRLEAVLTDQFANTQRDVHVITESLRRSGRLDSDIGRTTWTGDIKYGGPSAGSVHDPVKYAKYELNRGTKPPPGETIEGLPTRSHDFMRSTRFIRYRKRYVAAIVAHFRDET